MYIQVLTVEGTPHFYANNNKIANEIDIAVRLMFGTQKDGTSHNWKGIPDKEWNGTRQDTKG